MMRRVERRGRCKKPCGGVSRSRDAVEQEEEECGARGRKRTGLSWARFSGELVPAQPSSPSTQYTAM